MKILKSFLMAIMVLLTLNVSTATTYTLNTLGINCSEDVIVMTLEIPQLDLVRDIQLTQSEFDIPVIVEIAGDEGVIIEVEMDGTNARLIRGDGINTLRIGEGETGIRGDGINTILRIDEEETGIRGDGINTILRIDDGGTGIIRGDGINTLRTVTVRQAGMIIFSETL